jgi:hypothetical protein
MDISKPVAFILGFVSAVAYGGNTWCSSKEHDFSTIANGNLALADLSYWVDDTTKEKGVGVPGVDDDLIFDGGKGNASGGLKSRLRFSNVYNFSGNSLQIGTENIACALVFDGGLFKCDNAGLRLKRGNWWIHGGGENHIRCNVDVLAKDADMPFVFHVSPETLNGCMFHIDGKLKGSADAQLVFGPWPTALASGDLPIVCASNTSFYLHDISAYSGTITVTSRYANVSGNEKGYGTRLVLMPQTVDSEANLRISRGGVIALGSADSSVTVGGLLLDGGSRIDFSMFDSIVDGSFCCLRAKNSLSVQKGSDKVEILWKARILGMKSYRIPILVGPQGATFSEEDFKITLTSLARMYNPNIHLKVENDALTGLRTLYVVANGCVCQESNYNNEYDKGNLTVSSITNDAAWWNGLAPHSTNCEAFYYTEKNLRTLYAPAERYEFPCVGFIIDGGKLVVQTQTCEVPELWANGGEIGVGDRTHNDTVAYPIVSLVAPKIHLLGENPLVMRAHIGKTFILKGEVEGSGDIAMKGWSLTGNPAVHYFLDGLNTNYTGSISVESVELRPDYHNFNQKFPTLHVLDGRNLGGRKMVFDPRALTLTTLARLSVTNNATVELADGLNRGVYIKSTGRFYVTGSGVLDVRWPVLLSGKMWKEGTGTLVLGGGLKHELQNGGELTDEPRAGSNLFEIVAGTVKIAHPDALSGAVTAIGAGASLQLVLDQENARLARYGIRNTAVEEPFVLDESFGGKLPLGLDVSKLELPSRGNALTNALVTVRNSVSSEVRSMLPVLRPLRSQGLVSSLHSRDNGDGTTTFYLVSGFKGLSICIR